MVDEKTKALAEQIVQYETQDKGFFGKLFAFEARDGFWSKLVKVVNNISSPIVFGVAGFALAATGFGAGVVVASLAAGTAALLGGALARSSVNAVLEQMHDSQKSGLSQFGHFLSAQLSATALMAGTVAAGMAITGVPLDLFASVFDNFTSLTSSSSLAYLTAEAALPVITGSIISAVLGDRQLMQQSENARGLAEVAISKGQSVEQVLAPQRANTQAAAVPQQSYVNSVTPDEFREMQARMQQGAPAHGQRQTERAATTQSHEPVVAG